VVRGRATTCQQTQVGLSRGFEGMGKVFTRIAIPWAPGVRVVAEVASFASTWLGRSGGQEAGNWIF